MVKKIGCLKMNIEAGKASPAPPVGPALGLRGLNMMNFCKEFNDMTKDYISGTIVPTRIDIFADKSIKINLQSPTCTHLLKSYLLKLYPNNKSYQGIELDSRVIYHIASLKIKDCPMDSLESLSKSISSSCASLGIKIVIRNKK